MIRVLRQNNSISIFDLTKSEDCVDKISNCKEQLGHSDYCESNDDHIRQFFQEQCPKSCELCKYKYY